MNTSCHKCKNNQNWTLECVNCPTNFTDTITFHKMNGIKPSIQSSTFKLIEEIGELCQMLGKESGASGEEITQSEHQIAVKTALETLDTAQAAVTLFLVLCEEYGLPIGQLLYTHQRKLTDKKYLVME